DLGTIGFLVELEDAISRFGDALVAIGTRHRDPRARTVELQALERRDDFVGAGACSILRSSSLVPSSFQAENRLGHMVRRVGRRRAEARGIFLLEPGIQL